MARRSLGLVLLRWTILFQTGFLVHRPGLVALKQQESSRHSAKKIRARPATSSSRGHLVDPRRRPHHRTPLSFPGQLQRGERGLSHAG